MFSFFKKKNKPVVCNHKWKDFPWYIKIEFYDTEKYAHKYDWRYTAKVFEPYVCVKCKQRRDELLFNYDSSTKESRDKKVEELQTKYSDRIKPIVEIQDLILDEQLVDRRDLELLEELNNPSDKFAGLDLFTEIERMKKEIAATSAAAKTGEDNEQYPCN